MITIKNVYYIYGNFVTTCFGHNSSLSGNTEHPYILSRINANIRFIQICLIVGILFHLSVFEIIFFTGIVGVF